MTETSRIENQTSNLHYAFVLLAQVGWAQVQSIPTDVPIFMW